jgi:hypothetical protein
MALHQFYLFAHDANSPTGSTREVLRACLRRQRRHLYQPRATPWAHRPKAILSAEGAIHSADGWNRVPRPRRDLSRSAQMKPMRQAVGLQEDTTARKPRALPWAGMNQAFGLRARDMIGPRNEWCGRCAHVQTPARGPGLAVFVWTPMRTSGVMADGAERADGDRQPSSVRQ